MAEEWVLDIRDHSLAGGVPFFFKQWGGVRRKQAGRVIRGQVWNQLPALAAILRQESPVHT
jgi:protein gp37